ncbi:hypothetical protein [Actinophytocola sp.]|uniref:hypothetical protein n=1 Tax=Actinophytocola sp. TaxID=1872138 RepID=UPI003D6C27FF
MSANARGLASRIPPELLVCSIHRAADGTGRRPLMSGLSGRYPPKQLLRRRGFVLDDLRSPYPQRADRAEAGQLLTWQEPPEPQTVDRFWRDLPAPRKLWTKALRTGFVWADNLYWAWSHSRSHLPVLATFVDFSGHWLGMIWIAWCDTIQTECLTYTPDHQLWTLETTCRPQRCDRDDCDGAATGAAAVDILRVLWNKGMDECPDVPRELVIADEHVTRHPGPSVQEAIETLATFFLVAEEEDRLKITSAGETWLLAHERIGDKELLEDALPKERSNKIKATFHGAVVNSTVAISGATVGDQTLVVFDETQRRTWRELADAIEAERAGVELTEADDAELDEALAALRDAADEAKTTDPGRLRRALRTVARLGGGLLLGVTGNALYESAKAMLG